MTIRIWLRAYLWLVIATLVARHEYVAEFLRGAVLVPVPLHSRKQRERGYNQGLELARTLAAALGGGTRVAELLKRVADTMYLVSCVGYGAACPPLAFGISRISSVSNLVRSMRARRGVLLPLMNSQRPSATPLVCDNFG